jgi:hypothetical protein
MIALLFLLLLFAGVAAACIAGWTVDSRDSRFSLWPLNHVAPDDPPESDARPLGAPKPAPQARDYPSQSAGLLAHPGIAPSRNAPRTLETSCPDSSARCEASARGRACCAPAAPTSTVATGGPLMTTPLAERRRDLHNTSINLDLAVAGWCGFTHIPAAECASFLTDIRAPASCATRLRLLRQRPPARGRTQQT